MEFGEVGLDCGGFFIQVVDIYLAGGLRLVGSG
jgi:hypothetical protein